MIASRSMLSLLAYRSIYSGFSLFNGENSGSVPYFLGEEEAMEFVNEEFLPVDSLMRENFRRIQELELLAQVQDCKSKFQIF